MQKNSKNEYSRLSTPINSKGRMFFEKKNILRSAHQRDRDRIIHSTAFRRLKHKTQVFVNTSGDHYRTRITHSLEVAQIARTLTKYFKLNEDLSETLSLSHDLGHTPFGHAGEESLNECMQQYGGFDHNIQTIRIVTLLENRYYNFRGLNLTLETLDGLIKHNGPIEEPFHLESILGKNLFNKKIDLRKNPSLEAQISSISDDIAYNSHDLEDGLNAHLFDLNDLMEIPVLSDIVKKHRKRIKNHNKELIVRQIVRETINEMVKDIIINTKKNLLKYKIKNINDIHKSKRPIVCFSLSMNLFDMSVKSFLKNRMYFNKDVLKKTNKGKMIIKKLFLIIKKKPNKFIKKDDMLKKPKERAVCDFIAGMTDRFAINLYNSTK